VTNAHVDACELLRTAGLKRLLQPTLKERCIVALEDAEKAFKKEVSWDDNDTFAHVY
jgi:hypothetical protein